MAAPFKAVNSDAEPSAPELGGGEFIIMLCTAPDDDVAQALAERLLAERLAACVTLLPKATSIYLWQGQLERQSEVQMLIKSQARCQQDIISCIKQHHPYQTPELLVLPVQGGDADYLAWLHACLR